MSNYNDFNISADAEATVEDAAPEVVEETLVEEPIVEDVTEELAEETPAEEAPVVEDKKAKLKAAKKSDGKTVAIHVTRNLHWKGVGSLDAGYHILDEEVAEVWLALKKQVRLATPEEIASKVNS